MIHEFFARHSGSRIAVLGSAPTLELYHEREDLAIAVNGASQIDRGYDYFLTGHQTSHLKSWFRTREGISRIINSMSAVYDPQLYPDEEARERLIKEYEESMPSLPSKPDLRFNRYFRELPQPAKPHGFFYYGDAPWRELPGLISREQTQLYAGGTSACLAVQVAHIMGAGEIHVYGCAFDNDSPVPFKGERYFYAPKEGERGHTDENQRKFMDSVIAVVEQQGTPVFVHGPSRLEHHRKVD